MNKWCNKVRLVVEDSYIGRVSEWLKERDCKFRRVMPNGGSNPPPPIFITGYGVTW